MRLFAKAPLGVVAVFSVLALANLAAAATATINAEITVNGVPVTAITEQNMSFEIGRVAGKTSYVSSDLKSVLPAKIKATQEPYVSSTTTIPSTIVLTKAASSSTATLSLTCRNAITAYAATVAGGCDCLTPITTLDGLVYISVYPTAVDFSVDNTVGAYTGQVTITTNYY